MLITAIRIQQIFNISPFTPHCSSIGNQCSGLKKPGPTRPEALGDNVSGQRGRAGDSHSVGGPPDESGQQKLDGHRIGGLQSIAKCNDSHEFSWSQVARASIVLPSAGAYAE